MSITPLSNSDRTASATQARTSFLPPERIDTSEFYTKPAPFDFVLPGLTVGTVGALVSPGGAGKSMFALQASSIIAGSPDDLGLGLTSGRAVYLPAEDPKLALWHRMHALATRWDPLTRERVRDNLHMFSLVGKEPDLLSDAWLDWIESMMVGSRILFIDTLRCFHELEENSSGEMASVMSRMRRVSARTQCAIVFLHHSSKSSALNGQTDQQQASRGSSALVDNARWQSYLSVMSLDEAARFKVNIDQRDRYVRFGVNKVNYAAPIVPRWFRRGEGGVLFPWSPEVSAVPTSGRRKFGE